MDAETFGHHRPGLEDFLFQIYQDKKISKVFVSELIKEFGIEQETEVRDSTWSSEEQDFWLGKKKEHSFTLWHHPENPIHELQWEFTYFVIDLVKKVDPEVSWYKEVRQKLDQALQSDQYWWASAKPWWSLEMIEQGAKILKEVVFSIPDINKRNKNKAEEYYRQIIDLAFQWQRSGKIRQAYRQAMDTVKLRPYKNRVLAGQFNAMVLEFEDEMNKAIKDQEFEKAIKWRDAIYKLKNGMDIYDVLHVVDDLRQMRRLPSLKDYWENASEDFSVFAKKHFVDFQEKKFKKKQPKHFLNEIKAGLLKKRMGHPLGFSKDEYNNIYFCEVPSQHIEYWIGERGWDSMSIIKFSQPGIYNQPHQCSYKYENGKVRITIKPQSLVNQILKFLKQHDVNRGKTLKLAVLAESQRWAPVFFKKNNKNELVAKIPYKKSVQGQGFKFKILGWKKKK